MNMANNFALLASLFALMDHLADGTSGQYPVNCDYQSNGKKNLCAKTSLIRLISKILQNLPSSGKFSFKCCVCVSGIANAADKRKYGIKE